MTTPTTRETADHAELARMLRVKAHIENLRCRPGHHVQFGTPSVVQVPNYWNRDLAADLEALLSEIAALKGERDGLDRIATDLQHKHDVAVLRLTQAERQRDELRKALEFYAQPIWSIRGEFPEPSPHSEYRPDCGDTARQALANQGAD